MGRTTDPATGRRAGTVALDGSWVPDAGRRPASVLSAFLRFFFRHLYTTVAWSYDIVAWVVSLGQWSGWQNVGLAALPEGITLEIGHGPGHLLAAAAQGSRVPFGLDLSPQMSRLAARRLRGMNMPVRLVRAKAQALPFATDSFDGVLSTFPTEYITQAVTIAEARRVIKPGGKMVLILVGISTGKSLPDRFAAWVFRVTGQGQSPGGIPEGLFPGSGMESRAEWISLPRSAVLRVELKKPGT